MKINFKKKKIFIGIFAIVVICVIFIAIYLIANSWPSKILFGWREIVFLVVVLLGFFIVIKIIKMERQERKAKKIIGEVINNPELLKEKLNHPEIIVGGKTQKIEKVYEYAEDGSRIRLDAELKDGEVQIRSEEMVQKETPPETKKKKNSPHPRKKGGKKKGTKKTTKK